MMRYRQCLCHNFPRTIALWTALWSAPSKAPGIYGLWRCTNLSLLPTDHPLPARRRVAYTCGLKRIRRVFFTS